MYQNKSKHFVSWLNIIKHIVLEYLLYSTHLKKTLYR